MTSKQFNVFISMLLDRLKAVANETDEVKKNEKLEKIISDLQNMIKK